MKHQAPLKLALVEDQLLFRKGLLAILSQFEDLEICLEADNGKKLVAHMESAATAPDVVLLDMMMPEMDGIQTTKWIRSHYEDLRIIILSVHHEDMMITKMVELGVNGYLAKNAEPAEVYHAIKNVHEHGFYFDAAVQQLIRNSDGRRHSSEHLPDFHALSTRETEVLELICREYTNAEIAEKLVISARTVDGHRLRLLEKTGARNTAGLVMYAMRNNLVPML